MNGKTLKPGSPEWDRAMEQIKAEGILTPATNLFKPPPEFKHKSNERICPACKTQFKVLGKLQAKNQKFCKGECRKKAEYERRLLRDAGLEVEVPEMIFASD